MERERSIDRSIHKVTSFSSVQRFLETYCDLQGILTIYDGPVPIDVLISPAHSDITICFFHGAIEQHFRLPVLSGLGISGGLKANRVFISDPSLILDDELMLAWYAGNFFQEDLQNKIAAILSKIFEALGSRQLVFFGGSGGGFAALYFATRFDDSFALVFNPQTNIAEYNTVAVQSFVEKAFLKDIGEQDPLSLIPENIVTDLCDLYTEKNHVKIGYLQNTNDTSHVEHHLQPFLRSLHPEIDALVYADAWAEGHSPPPKKLLSEVLNVAAETRDLNADLTGLGFRRVGAPFGSDGLLPHDR